MARQPSVVPVPTDDGSFSAASVLPGVPLPAWAAGPPTAEPAPEPVPTGAAPEPELELVSVGAVAGQVDATATTELRALSALPVEAEAPAAENAPVSEASPYGASTVLPPGPAPVAPAVPPTAAAGGPAHHGAAPTAAAPAQRGNRRLLLLIGVALVVALGAFAAFVTPGFLVSSSAETPPAPVPPAATVTLPATVAGYTAVTTPAGKTAAAAAAKAFAATGVRTPTAAVYAHGTTAVTLAAGPASGDPAGYLAAWQKTYAVTGVAPANSGQAAVKAQCGATTVAGKAAAACGFAGPQVAGAITVPGATPAQAAKLLPTFVAAPVRH